jgi:segregation and condensation protein A
MEIGEKEVVGDNAGVSVDKVGQEQIHDLLFGEKLSWQAIIYDLINTEQLDPWDIDIALLSDRFLIKIRELEEANFFVSSKVLLAAALLLRIKSEILLHKYLPSLDDILFGRKEEKQEIQDKIEFDENVPELVLRTPLPRLRKVTLQELMASLGNAINTEHRRIKRIIVDKQREQDAAIVMPRKRINVQDKMKEVYEMLEKMFNERKEKFSFKELSGMSREEQIGAFIPLLHLDNQQKIWLEQEEHLGEIWVWMRELYEKHYAKELEQMKKEVEEALEEIAMEKTLEEIEEGVMAEEDVGSDKCDEDDEEKEIGVENIFEREDEESEV